MKIFFSHSKTPQQLIFRITYMSVLVSAVVLFTGCSQNLYNMNNTPPAYNEEKPPPPPVGTVWTGPSANNCLFADNKARYVNDIVTIVLNESTTGANDATTNTSRDSSATSGINGIMQISPNSTILSGYQLGGSQTNALKGTGQTSRDGNLTGTITARVIRVMANSNMVIEGRRQLTINAEDQYIIITGIIRSEDITTDNNISSSNIADARIFYTGKGVVDDKQRPGWLTRMLDWVWPF